MRLLLHAIRNRKIAERFYMIFRSYMNYLFMHYYGFVAKVSWAIVYVILSTMGCSYGWNSISIQPRLLSPIFRSSSLEEPLREQIFWALVILIRWASSCSYGAYGRRLYKEWPSDIAPMYWRGHKMSESDDDLWSHVMRDLMFAISWHCDFVGNSTTTSSIALQERTSI
jgi:hypothetical protein